MVDTFVDVSDSRFNRKLLSIDIPELQYKPIAEEVLPSNSFNYPTLDIR